MRFCLRLLSAQLCLLLLSLAPVTLAQEVDGKEATQGSEVVVEEAVEEEVIEESTEESVETDGSSVSEEETVDEEAEVPVVAEVTDPASPKATQGSEESAMESVETPGSGVSEEEVVDGSIQTIDDLMAEFSTDVAVDSPSNIAPSFVIPNSSEVSSSQELESRLSLTVTRGEEQVSVNYEVKKITEGYQVTLTALEALQPGVYHLEAVLDSSRGANRRLQAQFREFAEEKPDILLLETDFQWGTVALNTDRPTYQVGDTAYISLSFLGGQGEYVCSQAFNVLVTDAAGNTTTTEVSETEFTNPCLEDALPLAQYAFSLPIEQIGAYKIVVQVPEETQPRVIASLLAQEKSLFRVNRSAPTRALIGQSYSAQVTVVPQVEVVGTINEYIPAGIKVEQIEPAGMQTEVLSDGRTRIYRKGIFLVGEEFTISYLVTPTGDSTELLTFGPLEIEGTVSDPAPPVVEAMPVEEEVTEEEVIEEVTEEEVTEEMIDEAVEVLVEEEEEAEEATEEVTEEPVEEVIEEEPVTETEPEVVEEEATQQPLP